MSQLAHDGASQPLLQMHAPVEVEHVPWPANNKKSNVEISCRIMTNAIRISPLHVDEAMHWTQVGGVPK